MAERAVDPREGLKERLPSGSIPGVFHKFGIHRKLDVTDFRWHPDEEGTRPGTEDRPMSVEERQDIFQFHPKPWSFQPQALLTPEMSAEEQELLSTLSENRVYHHPRRMKLTLRNKMPSYATLNGDVLPEIHQVQPIESIDFEIPVGHHEATSQVRESVHRRNRPAMSDMRRPSPESTAFDTEVTCWHPLPGNDERAETIYHERDIYLTKENMTIISDMPSFKHINDQIYHEALNEEAIQSEAFSEPDGRDSPFDIIWNGEYRHMFEGEVTLVRTDRSGQEHRHSTAASTLASRKDVTRPGADDEFCFVTVERSAPGVLSNISVMMPQQNTWVALESEAEGKRRERLASSSGLLRLCGSAYNAENDVHAV
ncbi:hypothetical protein B9479_006592 [Cryptococcus floricola]|uniref:Uncharacterized protein n=1 Tax=Cryptococcus floricola TaxID=2591691 RepID=A0A5D3AQ72_9TREE|nr:hypothetical protein B9479_006592 [Cryptococcus floricola]